MADTRHYACLLLKYSHFKESSANLRNARLPLVKFGSITLALDFKISKFPELYILDKTELITNPLLTFICLQCTR